MGWGTLEFLSLLAFVFVIAEVLARSSKSGE